MTLESLRCFCAVVEEGSFRAAADRVHRSQPAVSQQIKSLEQELGHTLLERKDCRRTPQGHALYERARRLLNDADSMQRALADFDRAQPQELRVGTSDTTALYVLPPVVARFAADNPQTRLTLINRSSDAVAEQVARGELDLGIVTLPLDREGLEQQELFQQDFVLVTPRDHALGNRKRVKLSALQDEGLLMMHAQTRTGAMLREHFRDAAFEPRIALDSASFEVIKRFVAEGVGMSILPRLAVTPADTALATVEVPGLPQVRIGAIWRQGAYRTQAEQGFVELLRG
jgi:DNA-binding transcriptional LysR family regulator